MKGTIVAALLALGLTLSNSGCATTLLLHDAGTNLASGKAGDQMLGMGEFVALPVAVAADVTILPGAVIGACAFANALHNNNWHY
jgi:hypothetical protein